MAYFTQTYLKIREMKGSLRSESTFCHFNDRITHSSLTVKNLVSTKFVINRVYLGLTILLLAAGVSLIFYLSWLPDPMLSKYDLLPNWLTKWTDAQEKDTIRTAVPFVCLGLVIGSYLATTGRNWRWWLRSWIGLILLVLIAEVDQLILPHRSFDWDDVAWGASGSIGGLLLIGLCFLITRFIAGKLRHNNHKSLEKIGYDHTDL